LGKSGDALYRKNRGKVKKWEKVLAIPKIMFIFAELNYKMALIDN